jgi:hypothetical protein
LIGQDRENREGWMLSSILTGLDQSECDESRSRRRVEKKGIGKKGKRWKEREESCLVLSGLRLGETRLNWEECWASSGWAKHNRVENSQGSWRIRFDNSEEWNQADGFFWDQIRLRLMITAAHARGCSGSQELSPLVQHPSSIRWWLS